MSSIHAKDLVTGVLGKMFAFEVEENYIEDESWLYGTVADDETAPMPVLSTCKECNGNGMTLQYTDVGGTYAVPVCVVRNPTVVALVKDKQVFFAIQNMLFYDTSRVHAWVALLQLLDVSEGVLTIPDASVEVSELVTLVFMIMWVSPDAHDCLPFNTASNPTTAYYLLFEFCTSSYNRFRCTAAAINPSGTDSTNVYSVRKVVKDDDDLYVKVPRTNYCIPSKSDPFPAKRRDMFVRKFLNYCARAEKIPQFYAWNAPPLLSVVDCNIDPYTYPFKPLYFKRGLRHAAKLVVWVTMLAFERSAALPTELVIHMLRGVPELCAFDETGIERLDAYAAHSEPDSDLESIASD